MKEDDCKAGTNAMAGLLVNDVKKDACITPPKELERDLKELEGLTRKKVGDNWKDLRIKIVNIKQVGSFNGYEGGKKGFKCNSTAAIETN
jgi:hypothetical protein